MRTAFWAVAGAAICIAGRTDEASAAAPDSADSGRGQAAATVVQSHRGAGGLDVENTTAAFELGWELGTYPEADLRTTADGVIVAFHDATFKRLVRDCPPDLQSTGPAALSWERVAVLDLADGHEKPGSVYRVPRIEDVFGAMRGRPERHLYVDIKEVDLEQLARLAAASGVAGQLVLASPDHGLIRRWKKLLPESGTLLWMGGSEGELAGKLAAARAADFEGITQLQMHVRMKEKAEDIVRTSVDPFNLSDAFLRTTADELKSRGIVFQTFPYGGFTPDIYWKLLDTGVVSFASDHPDVTQDAIRRYLPQSGEGGTAR